MTILFIAVILLGCFLVWRGIGRSPVLLGIGVACLLIGFTATVAVPRMNTPEPGEQAISEQWERLKEAIPGWDVQSLLIVHLPDQAEAAKAIGSLLAEVKYTELQDPMNQPDQPLEDMEYRVTQADFDSLLKQHTQTDMILIMPGLPKGLDKTSGNKGQRLVIADLSPEQWDRFSGHPCLFAGIVAGSVDTPAWQLMQKQSR